MYVFLLQLSCNSSEDDISDHDLPLQQYDSTVKPKQNVCIKKANRIFKNEIIGTYSMESKNNRGVFFMANIVNFETEKKRNGADEDAYSLLSLFKQMNFKLHAYKDTSKQQFFQKLDELLCSKEIQDSECFVMALMTHGYLAYGTQWVSFHDGLRAKINTILQRFDHKNCPYLIGKPKIFILPFCRGELLENVLRNKIQIESIGSNIVEGCINCKNSDHSKIVGQMSDVIICYATKEGFVAFREPDKGSWYIQMFVETMAKFAYNTSFEDILKIVHRRVGELSTESNEVQTPNYVNIGFNKLLFFNPGKYKSSYNFLSDFWNKDVFSRKSMMDVCFDLLIQTLNLYNFFLIGIFGY